MSGGFIREVRHLAKSTGNKTFVYNDERRSIGTINDQNLKTCVREALIRLFHRLQGCPLVFHQFFDSRFSQCQHRIQLVTAEGVALCRALQFDKS